MLNNKIRILIGSPVQQKPEVLQYFLEGLKNIIVDENILLSFYFVDNNKDLESKKILSDFKLNSSNNILLDDHGICEYSKNEYTHYWPENVIWRVAEYKNIILKNALDEGYDYVFLIDSDILIHPETINQLLKAEKPIVANIFWTSWQPHTIKMPQVWVRDIYTMYNQHRGECLTDFEIIQRTGQFIDKLRVPGLYEVGGLGACTLIHRHALKLGVSFSEIPNISFWGEDRHFCIRAMALGLPLYVDTHLPAYHIYRSADLPGASDYLTSIKKIN